MEAAAVVERPSRVGRHVVPALVALAILVAPFSSVLPALVAVCTAFALWLADTGGDAWRKPVYLIQALLPVSTILALLVAAGAGEVSGPVTWVLLWRELLLIAMAGFAVVALWVTRTRLTALDVTIALFGTLVVAYTLLGLGSNGSALSFGQRALGARSWILPCLAYAAGRAAPADETGLARDFGLLRRLAWFICGAAFLEFVLLGEEFWQRLDYASYLMLTGLAPEQLYHGVPINFFYFGADQEVHRRWVGFMGSLLIGFWMINAAPVLLAGQFADRRLRLWPLLLAILVTVVGSRTRAALLAILVAGAFVVVLRRRWMMLLPIPVTVFALVTGYLMTFPDEILLLAAQFDVQLDPSTVGHITAIAEGIQHVVESPLGGGVGTAGYVGRGFQRAGESGVGENLYLSVAAELGWLGLAVFACIVGIAVVRLTREALRTPVEGFRWALPAGLAAATLGYAAASLTTEVWRSLQGGSLYWWLLGVATTMTASPAAAATPAPVRAEPPAA